MLTGLVLTSGARADLGFNPSEGWFQAAHSVDGQFFDQDGGISENDGVSDAPSLAVTSPLKNCNPACVGWADSGQISLTGIGSSGTDGFALQHLPAVSEWVSLDLACSNFGDSAAGAELNAQSHGSVPGGILSSFSLLNVDGSSLRIAAEFPGLGATSYSATISNDGQVVGEFGGLPFSIVSLPEVCLRQAAFERTGAIHFVFSDLVTLDVALGGSAVGDPLTLEPEDASVATPDTLIQVEARFANTGDLLLQSAFAGLSSEAPAPAPPPPPEPPPAAAAIPALSRWGTAVFLLACRARPT